MRKFKQICSNIIIGILLLCSVTGIKVNAATVDLGKIPEYTSEASISVNSNKPYFTAADKKIKSFETYSSLDKLGRCGVAYAEISQDIMPTEKRGDIGMVKPSGWHTVKYSCITDRYLYNRCHLIAYELAGENANVKNLTTGTRYLNIEGMLPYENEVTEYVKKTDNHVLYRVTPIFQKNELVVRGVLMEAYSVEDSGKGIQFCKYCYNVQPGVTINYATGDSKETGTSTTVSQKKTTQNSTVTVQSSSGNYVLNKNSKKIHTPSCSAVPKISKKNKEYSNKSISELESEGYTPCKMCNPQ